MRSLKILKATCVRARLSTLALIGVLFSAVLAAPTSVALENRFIDVAMVTWNGAPALPGSVSEVQAEIENDVKPRWRELTTVYGSPVDKRIEFSFGSAPSSPINLLIPMPCEQSVTAWGDLVREETYKRLGISNNKSRYLVIVAPDRGCIWSGVANRQSPGEVGGTLILHNSIRGFVMAHELGHLFGLGHTNLIRCPIGSRDGAWGTCRALEYGGSIDLMSNVDVSTPLSTYHQWRMGLLSRDEVVQSWKSETIEINSVDIYGKPRAIFVRDGSATYWIEYRRARGQVRDGLVIYRTDPPPGSAIISPNPADALQDTSFDLGTDIWMMNLDNYSYSNSSSSGSPSLSEGQKITFASGLVSLTARKSGENSVSISLERIGQNSLKAPKLSPPSTWISPESEILDAEYTRNINTVEKYLAKIDNREIELSTHKDSAWKPSYLDPFEEPKTLRQSDLPEGNYSLSIRLMDLAGAISPWSEEVKVKIDRGFPVLGNNLAIESFSNVGVGVRISDARDEGSSLCSTQLVNEDGWVISRSAEKSRPLIQIPNQDFGDRTVKVFDCLGNGIASKISGSVELISGSDMKLRGEWNSTGKDFPSGSIRCIKNCSAYLVARGSVGVILGSGSAQVQVGSGSKVKIESARSGSIYRAFPADSGSFRKTVRVTGKGFVLVGTAQSKLTLGKINKIERAPIAEDKSLEDSAQRVLSQFGFRAEDFSSDWSVTPIVRGTTLQDPTLDLCSGTFESELGRKERRQVMAVKREMQIMFLSTETVRYQSRAASEAAQNELKEKWKDCVKNGGGIDSSGRFIKYSILKVPESKAELVPIGNRLVAHVTIGEGESLRNLFAIYQFNGDLFTGLYIVKDRDKPFSDLELLRWFDVAGEMANRLQSAASGA